MLVGSFNYYFADEHRADGDIPTLGPSNGIFIVGVRSKKPGITVVTLQRTRLKT